MSKKQVGNSANKTSFPITSAYIFLSGDPVERATDLQQTKITSV